jgi:type II secretory pathway pseudopilin PulG
LEILLVVGIIAILAGIVILAINPTKQLGDTRNAQRRSDVLTILNAIYQYSIDNNSDLTDLSLGAAETADCDESSGVDAITLDDYLVTASSTYLTDIPVDPNADGSDSEYRVVVRESGRITVCAPLAAEDNDASIEVTR